MVSGAPCLLYSTMRPFHWFAHHQKWQVHHCMEVVYISILYNGNNELKLEGGSNPPQEVGSRLRVPLK